MPGGPTAYEFGPFRVEPGERRLSRAGTPVALPPKAFDLLVMLVEQPDRLLKKEELIERLWPGVFVEEVNLAQNISTIRRALGGDGRESFIQTVAGSGYRFIATVRRAGARAVPKEAGSLNPARHLARAALRSRLLVLPFRMLKPDADVEFLAFSLPDALTSTLSGLDSVVVRSSIAAARFASDPPDLARIAREADVDLVVSGTIVRAGNQLRVAAQLADAVAGTLIWSHTEQASVDDLFQLQDALVARIAESLSDRLTARDVQRLRRDVPSTPKAYEYYLRANEAGRLSINDAPGWNVARDLYLQSLQEDPHYAPAWTRLARVYRLIGKYRLGDTESVANLTRAEEAVQRALQLNPDLSMAHNLHAHIDIDRGRAADAMARLLDRAADGGDAEIFAGLVQACRFCGLLEASIAAHEQAQRCDPAYPTSVMHTYFVMRRYADALATAGGMKGYVYSLSLAGLGRSGEALQVILDLEQRPHRLPAEFIRAARTFIEGRRDDSVAALERMAGHPTDPENVFYVGRQFAALGADRQALAALARAVQDGYYSVDSLDADPAFDGIRPRPEFQALAAGARRGRDRALAVFEQHDGPRVLAMR